jgi:isoaspartyl peptidase/L-asparaginase-like protein (Ntn-hydrolase superfamily)
MHGRVGDSPIIGAGLYVDNQVGAAVATGLGELVMKTLGAFLAVELMRQGMNPQDACKEVIDRIVKNNRDVSEFQVGLIAINKAGAYGTYALQPGFTYALHIAGHDSLVDSPSYL